MGSSFIIVLLGYSKESFKLLFVTSILDARFGPILVKNVLNRSAIFRLSEASYPSILNVLGNSLFC